MTNNHHQQLTIRQEILSIIQESADHNESIKREMAGFVQGLANPDGGYRGRAAHSDLYYTIFAVELLSVLAGEFDTEGLRKYIETFGDGDGMDLLELACLARCWGNLPGDWIPAERQAKILGRIETFASADQGYNINPSAERGTAYGCFIALHAYQDLGVELPDPGGMVGCIESLRTADGGYANEPQLPIGAVPSTAAAITILHQLHNPIDPELGAWLAACHHPNGGFLAIPILEEPDLLSTAVGLHALSLINDIPDTIQTPCREYVRGLYDPRGGFRPNRLEEDLDAEYSYYGLLASGHLER
ncbi:MAG: hypothetical protein K9M57_07355 [Phycisphaerae bacterium]|nr:hypothetical protein [Phycisphaerae bacterium]